MDCSPPGSSVHGIFQVKILEWVAIPFSRGSSWPRGRTGDPCFIDRFFTIWSTRKVGYQQIAPLHNSLAMDSLCFVDSDWMRWAPPAKHWAWICHVLRIHLSHKTSKAGSWVHSSLVYRMRIQKSVSWKKIWSIFYWKRGNWYSEKHSLQFLCGTDKAKTDFEAYRYWFKYAYDLGKCLKCPGVSFSSWE